MFHFKHQRALFSVITAIFKNAPFARYHITVDVVVTLTPRHFEKLKWNRGVGVRILRAYIFILP